MARRFFRYKIDLTFFLPEKSKNLQLSLRKQSVFARKPEKRERRRY
ncbi:hypothetical protein SS05631_c26300 [Sinorhizobium sp. CCBAU 05631]|nr:hypothetical protein SS05631_c26300 [Sinorhizobium sp. CCBAU 05631]